MVLTKPDPFDPSLIIILSAVVILGIIAKNIWSRYSIRKSKETSK